MTKEQIAYLDSLPDEVFFYLLHINFAAKVPVWERCTKEEYVRACGEPDGRLTEENLLKWAESLFEGEKFRRVPYWNEGGGIWDQISCKDPSGYYYEKCVKYEDVLLLDSEMIEYCKTRDCMKCYFKKQ